DRAVRARQKAVATEGQVQKRQGRASPAVGNAKSGAATNDKSTADWVFALTAALRDAAPRVRFFAAQSLAKVGSPESGPAIIAMLRENADQDEYLRHAGVLALASA